MAGNDLSNSHNTTGSVAKYKPGPHLPSLVFPEDLDGQHYYPDVIKFGIYEKQGASYKAIKDRTVDAIENISNKFNAGLELSKQKDIAEAKADTPAEKKLKKAAQKFIKDDTERKKEKENESKGGPVVAEEIKGVFNVARAQTEKLKPDTQTITHKQSIFLNMPSSLVVGEAVIWEGSDMGAAGAMKAGGVGAAAESGILNNMGTILGGAATAVAGPAGAVLGAIAGGPVLQAGFESSFRVKANPFKEQTFQGISFRAFQFEFSLRARSENEIEEIHKIVQNFRAYSKPSFEGEKGSSTVFKYPHEFRIEFLTKNGSNDSYETNKYLPEIKYCVCTNVGSNFGGDVWRTFRGGAPTEVKLTLDFQETELITQEDVLGMTEVGFFKGYKGDGKGKF